MEAIKFKNFSNEDFSHAYNGVAHKFSAGSETYLEDFKAYHFCKHLVDREMNRANIPTNLAAERAKYEALCFPTEEKITPAEALDREEKKKEKKVDEEEFEDLKIIPKKKK